MALWGATRDYLRSPAAARVGRLAAQSGLHLFHYEYREQWDSRLNGCRLAYRMNLRLRRSGSEGFCPNANITFFFDMTSLLEALILGIVQSGARMNCVTAW